MRDAAHAYLLAGAVVIAMLSPLVHGRDDFPLSTYPMFSSRRPELAEIARARALTAEGAPIELSPLLVAGSAEPMQAVSTLRRALARGRPAASRLCEVIAERVAEAGLGASSVRLERITVDVQAWFAGDRAPKRVFLFAACPVRRKAR